MRAILSPKKSLHTCTHMHEKGKGKFTHSSRLDTFKQAARSVFGMAPALQMPGEWLSLLFFLFIYFIFLCISYNLYVNCAVRFVCSIAIIYTTFIFSNLFYVFGGFFFFAMQQQKPNCPRMTQLQFLINNLVFIHIFCLILFADKSNKSPMPSVTPIQGPIFLKNGSVPVVPLFSYPKSNNGSFLQIPVSTPPSKENKNDTKTDTRACFPIRFAITALGTSK